MTNERFQAQVIRVRRIADVVFPGCMVAHSTDDVPNSFSMLITNSTGIERLALFPQSTSIEGMEAMSDGEIETKIRENAKLYGHY
jgi:hypothetical protein